MLNTTEEAAAPKRNKKPATAKPKTAAKANGSRLAIARVPVTEMVALLAATGLTKSQLAKAAKVSPSLVSEWFGMGRGQLMHRDRFAAVVKAAKVAANGLR